MPEYLLYSSSRMNISKIRFGFLDPLHTLADITFTYINVQYKNNLQKSYIFADGEYHCVVQELEPIISGESRNLSSYGTKKEMSKELATLVLDSLKQKGLCVKFCEVAARPVRPANISDF